MGRRVRIIAGTTTNTLVYSGPHVVAEWSNNVLARSYAYGPVIDDILSMTTYGAATNTLFLPQGCNLGSVIALVNTNGAVVEQYRYTAWGEVTVLSSNGTVLAASAYGNRFTFQGREYSFKTGLYYFRARFYDPVSGRWLSNDPLGIAGGFNQYVFCGNCPTRYRDPFGLCKEGTTYQPRIQIQDAQDIMERHYNNSLKQWGLWNKFFGGQDIKYMNDGDVFMYQGKIIGASYMGNMAVGYTAYRNYGYLPAIGISVLGEYGWPDLGNVIGGMQGSFDANANGIAEGMLTEHYGLRDRIRLADRPGGGSR